MISLNRCIIITSYQSENIKNSISLSKDDFIICADGGYLAAKAEGIKPHILIGDFDSLKNEDIDCPVIRLQAEKDDTDTLVCFRHGLDKGFEEFIIAGGLGGRLDHTFANLQTLSYAVDLKKNMWIMDGKNRATMIQSGDITLQKEKNFKISLFSYTEVCSDVCISGVKYPLHDHQLSQSFPLGISNEFTENQAHISVKSGKLLILLSQD